MKKDKQYHIYSLSFIGYTRGDTVHTNSIMFSLTNRVTKELIKAARPDNLVFDKSPVMIACSYLGYMTEAEFHGKDMDS